MRKRGFHLIPGRIQCFRSPPVFEIRGVAPHRLLARRRRSRKICSLNFEKMASPWILRLPHLPGSQANGNTGRRLIALEHGILNVLEFVVLIRVQRCCSLCFEFENRFVVIVWDPVSRLTLWMWSIWRQDADFHLAWKWLTINSMYHKKNLTPTTQSQSLWHWATRIGRSKSPFTLKVWAETDKTGHPGSSPGYNASQGESKSASYYTQNHSVEAAHLFFQMGRQLYFRLFGPSLAKIFPFLLQLKTGWNPNLFGLILFSQKKSENRLPKLIIYAEQLKLWFEIPKFIVFPKWPLRESPLKCEQTPVGKCGIHLWTWNLLWNSHL